SPPLRSLRRGVPSFRLPPATASGIPAQGTSSARTPPSGAPLPRPRESDPEFMPRILILFRPVPSAATKLFRETPGERETVFIFAVPGDKKATGGSRLAGGSARGLLPPVSPLGMAPGWSQASGARQRCTGASGRPDHAACSSRDTALP